MANKEGPEPKGIEIVKATLTETTIPNHFSTRMSELERLIAHSVPPGGNWKDIPESVPSQRLKQIRQSYAEGKGSRSTYYGRLRPDAPSYTINTYFTRPGNGCHLHYDYEGGQHRTLSQREAARLQSFPDNFTFLGSKTSVSTQIGNAVPPLLGFQIAEHLPLKGYFVDLFSGAGGLGLGFKWAGWTPVVANDIEMNFLATYRNNIHDEAICGDIRDQQVFDALVLAVKEHRKRTGDAPLYVLGGPPCQGFSTAGNRRSMDDDRNWLFRQYKALLEAIRPDGFVFENVTGLLSMEGGRVFDMIQEELAATTSRLAFWKLRAEEYAVPQRRTRVILVGDSHGIITTAPPNQLTGFPPEPHSGRRPAVTVHEALSDLPPLEAGEDGSAKLYTMAPANDYQKLMRGVIGAGTYVERMGKIE